MSNHIPAFPFTPTDRSGQIAESAPGLTKLEYGALQITAAMIAASSGWPNTCDRHEIARRGVSIAAAVLAEANK